MRNMIILHMPTIADFEQMPEQMQQAISSVFAIWPSSIMPGTRPTADGVLLFAHVTADSALPIEQLIDGFQLPWTIYGMRSVDSYPVLDAAGNIIEEVDADGFIRRSIGPIVHIGCDSRISDYLVPALDENGTELPIQYPVTLTSYSKQGVEPWVFNA